MRSGPSRERMASGAQWKSPPPCLGSTGGHVNVIAVMHDITEAKKSEASLRASEELFDLAMRASNDGLWDWNMKTNTVHYSPRWKSMLGYAEDEIENSFAAWERLTDADGRATTQSQIALCVAGQAKGFSTEFRMRHKDGRWVDILSRATLIRDVDGVAVRMVGTHVDISERKQERAGVESGQRPAGRDPGIDCGWSPRRRSIWHGESVTTRSFWNSGAFLTRLQRRRMTRG
jgi:PAS domain S-box-containing protein